MHEQHATRTNTTLVTLKRWLATLSPCAPVHRNEEYRDSIGVSRHG